MKNYVPQDLWRIPQRKYIADLLALRINGQHIVPNGERVVQLARANQYLTQQNIALQYFGQNYYYCLGIAPNYYVVISDASGTHAYANGVYSWSKQYGRPSFYGGEPVFEFRGGRSLFIWYESAGGRWVISPEPGDDIEDWIYAQPPNLIQDISQEPFQDMEGQGASDIYPQTVPYDQGTFYKCWLGRAALKDLQTNSFVWDENQDVLTYKDIVPKKNHVYNETATVEVKSLAGLWTLKDQCSSDSPSSDVQ